jgi:transmembrane sensor
MFDRFRSRNNALSDEAIQWVVRLGGNPSPAERSAFEAWCRRSPAHAGATHQARALLEELGQTEVAAEYRQWVQALTPPPRGISRRALLVGSASAAATVAAVGLVGSGALGPPAGLFADQSTRIGQRRQSRLPDGSRVWLNSDSALSLDFSATSRKVSVLAGEALFEVAHDPLRPFMASTGDGQTRASAGRYALRREARHSAITVLSGTVEVRSAASTASIGENQRIAFSPDLLGQVETVDADALTAWVRGKLIFNRQSLTAIAAELERYVAGRVVVMGDRLRQLQLSGVFELDDTDALLRTVATLAKAEIVRLPLLTLIR